MCCWWWYRHAVNIYGIEYNNMVKTFNENNHLWAIIKTKKLDQMRPETEGINTTIRTHVILQTSMFKSGMNYTHWVDRVPPTTKSCRNENKVIKWRKSRCRICETAILAITSWLRHTHAHSFDFICVWISKIHIRTCRLRKCKPTTRSWYMFAVYWYHSSKLKCWRKIREFFSMRYTKLETILIDIEHTGVWCVHDVQWILIK